MTAQERAEGIAPDRVSDVAEWGDRPVLGKDFRDMTAEELNAADSLAQKILRKLSAVRSHDD